MAPMLRNPRTYSVRPGFGAQRAALLYYGDRESVERDFASVVLIEMEVGDAPHPPQLERWRQAGSDQVPYDELYMTLDRTRVIGRQFVPPAGGDLALSFFLHYFNDRSPLHTPWGVVALPPPAHIRPVHLRGRTYHFWN
jgi:hypothetical protein